MEFEMVSQKDFGLDFGMGPHLVAPLDLEMAEMMVLVMACGWDLQKAKMLDSQREQRLAKRMDQVRVGLLDYLSGSQWANNWRGRWSQRPYTPM